MATKTAPATLSPLVGAGLGIIARIEAKALECAERKKELGALQAELLALGGQLIALGAGRYQDEEGHVATVVAGRPQVKKPDRFELKDAEAEAAARELAGDHFSKLFDRHVYWTPKDGFAAIAGAVLTPAKVRDIVALTIIPGGFGGGASASVRWKQ